MNNEKFVMNVCVVWDDTAFQDHPAVGDMKGESLLMNWSEGRAYGEVLSGLLHWERHGCLVLGWGPASGI